MCIILIIFLDIMIRHSVLIKECLKLLLMK